MLDEHTFGFRQASDSWLTRFYQMNRPAIIAAAWFWLVFLILAFITLFTGWASLPFTLALHWLASLGAGVLAAWIHRRELPARPRYVRMGALAGFYLPLTTSLVILSIAIAAGIGTFGALIPLMIPYFVALPAELGTCSVLGALGAWLYKKIIRG